MRIFNSITDVWDFLGEIPMFQKAGVRAGHFELDHISAFCERLGNPQNTFPSIHVAGTNGKGTTCYLLEHVYLSAGYKTGIFTSPHLMRYNERVRIQGEEITDQKILEFFRTAAPIFDDISLTYFEISTALAFWAFADARVDIAIIEVGLGGRLDSTNIITPVLSVITSISFDHEQILGNTIPQITSEKAGIIKPGIPVVVGNVPEQALQTIGSVSQKTESKLILSSGLNPEWKNGEVWLSSVPLVIKTNFVEAVNIWNIAMVYCSVIELRHVFPLKENSVLKALESFQGLPARFEKLLPGKEWYFNGAHNPEAIASLIEAVNRKENSCKILILSMMGDKVKPDLLRQLTGFNEIYFYEQEGERAGKFSDVSRVIEVKKIDEHNIQNILNERDRTLVIFAGSFYFYSIVKRWIEINKTKNNHCI